MVVRKLSISGVFEIVPQRFVDERGFFSETYSRIQWTAVGINADWVHDNHSLSRHVGTLRGLHFQAPPFAQDKLIRVTRGSIFDVAVDLRRGSPTYAKWVSWVVSAEMWNQIFVPKGFAHGFVTLEPDTEVIYKVSAPYSRAHDRNIRFDDPEIGISWPINSDLVISEKDRSAPRLAEVEVEFTY